MEVRSRLITRIPSRIAVLASGSGSNLQAIVDACAGGVIAAEVVVVVSDRTDAFALDRARAAGIRAIELPRADGEARADYDSRLADTVIAASPDVVVLAGWMRILTMAFLGRFPGRVVNLHPALPGELPGTRAIERAFNEFERGERSSTGVMVHVVPDEGVDDGPVLGTAVVPIYDHDTLDTLAERVHTAEHDLLVTALADVCRSLTPAHPSSPIPTDQRS